MAAPPLVARHAEAAAMKRQRANDLDAEVRRLRLNRGLSDDTAARAREVARLWLEQDARTCLLRGAPADVAQALRREYAATGFMPESLRVFDTGWRELVDGD
jgi:hypothetical protein